MLQYIFYLILYGTILTYLVLGFIFSFEALLALNRVKGAKKWIRKWNTPKQFKRKLMIFLPFLHIGYFLLEILPYYIGLDSDIKPFDLEKIYKFIYENDD